MRRAWWEEMYIHTLGDMIPTRPDEREKNSQRDTNAAKRSDLKLG